MARHFPPGRSLFFVPVPWVVVPEHGRYGGGAVPASSSRGRALSSFLRGRPSRLPACEGDSPHLAPCGLAPSPSVSSIPESMWFCFWAKIYFINNQLDRRRLGQAGFSQAIHIFFSSKKNVNRLRKIFLPLERDLCHSATWSFPSARPWKRLPLLRCKLLEMPPLQSCSPVIPVCRAM